MINLKNEIPEEVREITYGNLIIKIAGKMSGNPSLILKNKEQPHFHYHLYTQNGEPKFHITLEPTKDKPSKHMPINVTEMEQEIQQFMIRTISKAKKIELNDIGFAAKKVVLLGDQTIYVDKIINPKKISINHEYEEIHTVLEEIDTTKNSIGVLYDDNGKERWMIFLNNSDVYLLDMSDIEDEHNWFDKNLNPLR